MARRDWNGQHAGQTDTVDGTVPSARPCVSGLLAADDGNNGLWAVPICVLITWWRRTVACSSVITRCVCVCAGEEKGIRWPSARSLARPSLLTASLAVWKWIGSGVSRPSLAETTGRLQTGPVTCLCQDDTRFRLLSGIFIFLLFTYDNFFYFFARPRATSEGKKRQAAHYCLMI